MFALLHCCCWNNAEGKFIINFTSKNANQIKDGDSGDFHIRRTPTILPLTCILNTPDDDATTDTPSDNDTHVVSVMWLAKEGIQTIIRADVPSVVGIQTECVTCCCSSGGRGRELPKQNLFPSFLRSSSTTPPLATRRNLLCICELSFRYVYETASTTSCLSSRQLCELGCLLVIMHIRLDVLWWLGSL